MKIDYVVPYVDNTDKNWIDLYNKYNIENKHTQSENIKRFSENKLFRYVFRGIEKFMPWINNVFLIVQQESQIPKWINRNTVKIVYHKDFIPEEYLPTFNSCTIECFLHRIPQLSPFYIYGNDDTYITDSISETDFFEGVMPKNKIQEPHLYHIDDEYERMCMNMNTIIFNDLNIQQNKNIFYTPVHFQQAFSKSITENIFNKFKTVIYNSISKFRSEQNISQYFFILYYMFSTNSKYLFKNVKTVRADIITEFDRIIKLFNKSSKQQLLCLNNNDNLKDIALISQFQKLFPDVSRYEI